MNGVIQYVLSLMLSAIFVWCLIRLDIFAVGIIYVSVFGLIFSYIANIDTINKILKEI